MFYYESLEYTVPIAFQGTFALVKDLKGNYINDYLYYNSNYEMQCLHICVFPMNNRSIVILFIDSKHKRYRKFYKTFKSKDKNEKLAIINYIIFSYSEEVYISDKVKKDIFKNDELIRLTKYDRLSGTEQEIIENLKDNINFTDLEKCPNLLSKNYSI